MGLRAKFNLVILAAFAVGFLIAAIVLNRVANDTARDQVLQNARIMMTAADAFRNYTANDLVRLLPSERDGKFVAETVPAYGAQQTFKQLQDAFSGFSYREAALNPTNPARDWEVDLINRFRENGAQQELVIERDTPMGQLLHMARPLSVRTEACLTCHNEPYDAPQALTRTYGTTNGFGWKLHETIGAQILTVPMAVALKAARDAYVKALIILAGTFAIVFIVMNLLLHYAIVAPVKRLSAMAEAVSLGQKDVESYIKPGKDEISALSVAFNRMRESLKQAIGMIE
jgi:protein-histidine pros-kinase